MGDFGCWEINKIQINFSRLSFCMCDQNHLVCFSEFVTKTAWAFNMHKNFELFASEIAFDNS